MLFEPRDFAERIHIRLQPAVREALCDPILTCFFRASRRGVFRWYPDEFAGDLNQPVPPLICKISKRTLQFERYIHDWIARPAGPKSALSKLPDIGDNLIVSCK